MMPFGVIAPLARSTLNIWMPRPFPGGRSTCVGRVSRRGELNVPTYATRPRAAWLVRGERTTLANDEIVARLLVVFRNERRDSLDTSFISSAYRAMRRASWQNRVEQVPPF